MKTRHLLLLAAMMLLLALLVAVTGDPVQQLFLWLKGHQRVIAGLADEHPIAAGAAYGLAFVAATALSLPVATVLTVFAGAVFGFTEALLLTLFAGATGATLAMLLSRHVFRDLVEARWPRQTAVIDRGVARDGGWYLLSLRLAPMPPFFVVNAAMGLTHIPARTFFLVSLVGLAPLDAVFVNAGHQIGRLSTPEDALSGSMLMAIAAIGIAPLLLRMVRRRWTKHPATH